MIHYRVHRTLLEHNLSQMNPMHTPVTRLTFKTYDFGETGP